MGNLVSSGNQQRLTGHRMMLTTDAFFAAALARTVPIASRRTAGERRGRKDRQEQRMSIHHRERRGSDL